MFETVTVGGNSSCSKYIVVVVALLAITPTHHVKVATQHLGILVGLVLIYINILFGFEKGEIFYNC